MTKLKRIIKHIFVTVCLLSVLCSCSEQESTEASRTKITTVHSQDAQITESILTSAITQPPVVPLETAKQYTHSNKAFTLKDCSTSLFMVNGWEILSGGIATEQQSDQITSFPAILQYLDTKTTLTITVANEIEEKETFLANTEELYISAYGSAYDDIEITEFEQITIDEFDSFRIKANVVVNGESFTMIHIITNDVSGKTFSWMLLDSDGEFADFDLVEAICYPKIIEKPKSKRFDRENFDDMYKFNMDDFVN